MNPNDPAFPCEDTVMTPMSTVTQSQNGLTKREYFAAMAINTNLAWYINGNFESEAKYLGLPRNYSLDAKVLAARAVYMADALISELSKGGTK